jgi:Mrp family chromosome partitioning ATPase
MIHQSEPLAPPESAHPTAHDVDYEVEPAVWPGIAGQGFPRSPHALTGQQPLELDGASRRPAPSRLDAARGETLLEHFRRIYLSLQPYDSCDVPSVIGVTSATRGEGRTTVATGIAAAMAADLEVPVVLVEVDLARPGLHRALDLDPEPGISEYLRGECDVVMAVRQITDRLFAIPAGNAQGEAPRLIRQLTTANLRARLDSSGAVLVLDLPPILATSYGTLASSMVEALVFVVRAGETTSPQAREALRRLDPSLVRGLVLSNALPYLPRWAPHGR